MACRQRGGNCDPEHEPSLKEMKGRWRRPVSGLKWYRQVQREFAALPTLADR